MTKTYRQVDERAGVVRRFTEEKLIVALRNPDGSLSPLYCAQCGVVLRWVKRGWLCDEHGLVQAGETGATEHPLDTTGGRRLH